MSVFDEKKKGIGRPYKDETARKVSVSVSLSLSTAERVLQKPSGHRSAFIDTAIQKAFDLEDFNNA
jgi:hypothetical protein